MPTLYAKLSTAQTISFGPVLDSTGAEYTGLVVGEVKISKNNGTPAALNAGATLTHKEVGVYELVLTTSDISAVGQATLTCSKTTYVAPPVTLIVLPAKVYDSLVGGTDNLEIDVIQWLGTAVSTPTVAGVPNVNAKTINDVATTSITAINANIGTTQPVNFTGTGASALVKGDAIDWNSVAVTGMPMPTYTQPTGFLAATFPSGTIANTTNITAGTITTVTNLTNAPTSGDLTATMKTSVQTAANAAIVALNLDQLISASGTADSGTTLTMVDAARTEGDADYWKGQLIKFTSGNIAGQTVIITDFNAATDTFSFVPATTQAVSTQNYVILPNTSVWEDTLAEHLVSGSTGTALNAAGSAGDPWATALPGAYGAGTAGRLVGRSLPDVVAGAAGGLFIAGSNAATTIAGLTTGALSCTTITASGAVAFQSTFATTGNVSMAAGLTITQSTLNGHGITVTGNGTGYGFKATGGSQGAGVGVIGGGTSGNGIEILTTSGTGIAITPTAGDGILILANGTSKHGISVTGGSAGTSDGIKITAGTGGVGLRVDTATFSGAVTLSSTLTVSGATTLTGAVSLGSTLGVTGTTTFAAINTGAISATTLATSGTTTLNALTVTNAVTISGATTFTGAVTATNASNQISLGTDMITAGTIAADAVGSSELSTAAVAKIFGTALTEAYRAAGATGTAAQILYELLAGLLDHSISGTTKSIRNIAGSTAKTYTLDSATVPTSITETT